MPLSRQSVSSCALEWIQERLTKLKEILERSSERFGLLRRKLLGPLRLSLRGFVKWSIAIASGRY